eukprot:scaffold45_cov337-Pavlova_lutheri.AAC.40
MDAESRGDPTTLSPVLSRSDGTEFRRLDSDLGRSLPLRSPASVNHEINFEHVHSCFAIRLARIQLDVLGSWNANREGKEGAGGEKKEEPTSEKRGKGRAVEDGGPVHELGARTAEDGRARADLAGAASLRSGDGVRPARRVRRGRKPPKKRGREGPQRRKRCVRRDPRRKHTRAKKQTQPSKEKETDERAGKEWERKR